MQPLLLIIFRFKNNFFRFFRKTEATRGYVFTGIVIALSAGALTFLSLQLPRKNGSDEVPKPEMSIIRQQNLLQEESQSLRRKVSQIQRELQTILEADLEAVDFPDLGLSEESLTDPWGKRFQFTAVSSVEPRVYEIRSAGKNQIFDDTDDLTWKIFENFLQSARVDLSQDDRIVTSTYDPSFSGNPEHSNGQCQQHSNGQGQQHSNGQGQQHSNGNGNSSENRP